MITVAKDSTGDFTSIQAAVDSIKSTPEIIYIKMVYIMNAWKSNLTMSP